MTQPSLLEPMIRIFFVIGHLLVLNLLLNNIDYFNEDKKKVIFNCGIIIEFYFFIGRYMGF